MFLNRQPATSCQLPIQTFVFESATNRQLESEWATGAKIGYVRVG